MWSYLGQNFLKDTKIKIFIAEKIAKFYTEIKWKVLIEIWPGKWALTRKISEISDNFFIIEKDEALIANYEEQMITWAFPKISADHIIAGDVLDIDVKQLLKTQKMSTKNTLVVGNLPYYITSPILRKFFGYGKQEFAGGIFLIQHEVAEKIMTNADKKSYLRRLLNHSYDVKYIKSVPAKAFKPIPKVKSAVIQLSQKNQQSCVNFEILQEFLDLVSPFSRKTLGRIQKILIKKHKTLPFSIPEIFHKKRLEELSWRELEGFLYGI